MKKKNPKKQKTKKAKKKPKQTRTKNKNKKQKNPEKSYKYYKSFFKSVQPKPMRNYSLSKILDFKNNSKKTRGGEGKGGGGRVMKEVTGKIRSIGSSLSRTLFVENKKIAKIKDI